MHQVIFGDGRPGLPRELDGCLVKVLEWKSYPRRYARCVTEDGLIYNVFEECLEEVTDVIVVSDSGPSPRRTQTVAERAKSRWGLNGSEGADQLKAMFTKSQLSDLVEDLYPLPPNLRVKRRDGKAALSKKAHAALLHHASS